MAAIKPYTLHVPKAVERQLQTCRASIRRSIADRLRGIVESVTAGVPPVPPKPARRAPVRKTPAAQGPPLRFYVLEGYRVSYLVNALTRRVVVLELQPAAG